MHFIQVSLYCIARRYKESLTLAITLNGRSALMFVVRNRSQGSNGPTSGVYTERLDHVITRGLCYIIQYYARNWRVCRACLQ